MKQLSFFDSIEPEPARRRQASGRSANPIIFNDYESYIKKFEGKKTTDDTYTPRDVFEAVLQYVGSIFDLGGKQILRPFYPGGDYQHASYPAEGVVVDNPPFSIFKKIVKFYSTEKIPFFLFGPGMTILNIIDLCSVVVVADPIVFDNEAKIRCNFATNLFETNRITTSIELTKLLRGCKSQNNTNKLPLYEYPAQLLSISELQTIARGDNDFNCEIGKDAIKIEYINNKKLYGPHLLVSKKKADEKFNIKRQITKKEEKERIVVNFTEQEKILCDILDEKK